MDEKLEKAFQTANYMVTLSNQKRIIFEEFLQSSIYYIQGSSFTVNRELISFVKMLVDLGHKSAIILDDNNIPVEIKNCKEFLKSIIELYSKATNTYLKKFSEMKSKRKIGDLVSL